MSEQTATSIESMFTSLVGNLPAAVYRCANDEHWTMAYISEYMKTLSGYSASDFLDNNTRSLASIIHPDDRHLVHDAVNVALEAGGVFSVRYRILHADGRTRWVRDSGCGVFDSSGQLKFLDGALFDETEHHHIEEKHTAQNRLHENIVAHGLPKIKNYIKALLDADSEETDALHSTTSATGARINCVRRLDRLIGNIVTLKGVDQVVDKMAVDSKSLLLQVISEITDVNGNSNAEIEYGELPDVYFNEALLKQLFSQLLDNAIKFAGLDQLQVRVDSKTGNGKTTFCISDNGIGFEEYFIDSAFDLCLRGQNAVSYPGDGFGLTVCQSILAANDENIWIESRPLEGSKIYFTVPAYN